MSAVKMGVLDMMRADSRIITALGPVDVAGVDEIASTVRQLAICGGPNTPLGLLPSTATRNWRYAPDEFLDEVVELPACSAEDIPQLLTNRARTAARTKALGIAVAGDYLIVDMNHGLGDGRLITMLNQVLGERLPPDRFPAWAHGTGTRHPLAKAFGRFYASDPHRAVAMLRNRRRVADAPAPECELVPWRRAPVVVAARTTNGAAASLRRRRDDTFPDLSVASIVFASIANEIRSHEIEVDNTVNVIFDCRRYLSQTSTVYGNFVSGVDLELADPGDPHQINRAIAETSGSGRPLAGLLVSALNFQRGYPRGDGYFNAVGAPRSPRAKLAFSDIGQVFAGSDMWSADPPRRFYNAINEPKSPDCIVLTITHQGADFDLTASFHGNVFAPHIIQTALDNVVEEPERSFMRKTGS